MTAEIQAAAVCQVRGERGQSAKDYWYQANKGVRKVRRARKTRKDSGKAQERRTLTTRREEPTTIATWLVIFALNCPRRKKRESHTASYSGGGGLHCLTHTADQFQWITMLEKVGPVVAQSNITELLMDSGAASHVRPCRMTVGYSYKKVFLKATGAQVTSQGTRKAKSQLVDVHGEKNHCENYVRVGDHEMSILVCWPLCRQRGCCRHGK